MNFLIFGDQIETYCFAFNTKWFNNWQDKSIGKGNHLELDIMLMEEWGVVVLTLYLIKYKLISLLQQINLFKSIMIAV